MIRLLDQELLIFDEMKIIQDGVKNGYINWDMDIQSLFRYADMVHNLEDFEDYQFASLEEEWKNHWKNSGDKDNEI